MLTTLPTPKVSAVCYVAWSGAKRNLHCLPFAFTGVLIFLKVHIRVSDECRLMRRGNVLRDRATGEENNALESRVVEEVVEGPEATVFRVRV